MRKDNRIIRIADLINDKLRKEQELEFYEKELRKLLVRMMWVRREIDLTNLIIKMIENESIPNILEDLLNETVE
jgi:hypothetical protein